MGGYEKQNKEELMDNDYLKVMEAALEAVSHALETIDAAENSGIKIHPSIGNRLNTAKMVVAETLQFAMDEQERQHIPVPSEEPAVNTKITYLYRDAENFKIWNDCVIPGIITPEQQAAILSCLDKEEYFIPHLVGLPEVKFGAADDLDLDHQWFKMYASAFTATHEKPSISVSASELVERFFMCKDNWRDLYALSMPGPDKFSVPSVGQVYHESRSKEPLKQSLDSQIQSAVARASEVSQKETNALSFDSTR